MSCGCAGLVAPARPIWKERYALIPMDGYCAWKRPDGTPYDLWIRIHWCLGARALGVAPKTLTVEASIRDWESWTGLAFAESRLYVVPGAL